MALSTSCQAKRKKSNCRQRDRPKRDAIRSLRSARLRCIPPDMPTVRLGSDPNGGFGCASQSFGRVYCQAHENAKETAAGPSPSRFARLSRRGIQSPKRALRAEFEVRTVPANLLKTRKIPRPEWGCHWFARVIGEGDGTGVEPSLCTVSRCRINRCTKLMVDDSLTR